jgi:hypothetical protein
MKKFVLFLSLIVFVGMVEAQIASIADINFESVPSGWTISPSNYWVANTDLYAGGHASYHGFVPIGNSGDTVIFTSPMISKHINMLFCHSIKFVKYRVAISAG